MIRDAALLEAYLRELLDAIPDASLMVDPTGRIVLANGLAEQMFGYERDTLSGRPLETLVPARFRQAHGGHCADYFTRPKTRPMGAGLMLFAQHRDGSEIPVEISLAPVETDQGIYVIGSVRGISESEERYRAVFDQIAAGIAHSTIDGRLLNVNEKFCEISGYTRQEALAIGIRDLTHPDDIEKSVAARNRLVAERGRRYERETRLIRKDGREVWAHITTSLVRGAGHRPLHFISVIQDVSAQKHAEAERRESELRFRQVTENIREVFWLVDPSFNHVFYISRAYEEIWGRSPDSLYLSPRDWLDTVHPEDRDRVLQALQQKLARGDFDEEYRIRRPDGSVRWIRARAFPVLGDDGKTTRVAGVAEDITDGKLVLETLRESERRFSAMLGNVELISVMLDRQARITYCNDYMLRLTGWKREEVIGKSWFEQFLPADSADEMSAVFLSLLADLPDAWHYENEIVTRSGERRFIQWNNGVLRSAAGEVIGTASIGDDVTDRKKAEEAIRRHSAALEQTMYSTISVIASIVELRDPYTHGHEHRVGEIAAAIGSEMELEPSRIEGLRIAGYLHDVGKIGVPAEILAKPTRLTQAEFGLVKDHAQKSYEILKRVEFPWPVAEIAWQHHERVDGSGYPRGLKGEQILLEARILAVADTVEAMASHRPYRAGLGVDLALAEIEKSSGKFYDASAVDACLRLFREKAYRIPS